MPYATDMNTSSQSIMNTTDMITFIKWFCLSQYLVLIYRLTSPSLSL